MNHHKWMTDNQLIEYLTSFEAGDRSHEKELTLVTAEVN